MLAAQQRLIADRSARLAGARFRFALFKWCCCFFLLLVLAFVVSVFSGLASDGQQRAGWTVTSSLLFGIVVFGCFVFFVVLLCCLRLNRRHSRTPRGEAFDPSGRSDLWWSLEDALDAPLGGRFFSTAPFLDSILDRPSHLPSYHEAMKEAVFAPPAYDVATSCRVATVTTDERVGQAPQATVTTVTVEPTPQPPATPSSTVVEVVVEEPPAETAPAVAEADPSSTLSPIAETKDEDSESYCSFTSSASQNA